MDQYRVRIKEFYLTSTSQVHNIAVLQWASYMSVKWTVYLHLTSGLLEIQDDDTGETEYLAANILRSARRAPVAELTPARAPVAPVIPPPPPVHPAEERDENGNKQIYRGRKK